MSRFADSLISEQIAAELHRVIKEGFRHMSQQLDNLTAQVRAMKGVADSSVALIGGLHAKLLDVLAAVKQGDNGAALQGLADELAAAKQEIADAVTANPLPSDEAPAPTPAV